jgi:hypothetical protein
MKFCVTRIVEVKRVDGSPGYVVQFAPAFFLLSMVVPWENADGLQYATIEEARACRRFTEYHMNGAKGVVVE